MKVNAQAHDLGFTKENEMATIEFNSTLDGRDLIEVPRTRNVFLMLREIFEVFGRKGYQVFGHIEYFNQKFEGEYRLVGPDEEFTIVVH